MDFELVGYGGVVEGVSATRFRALRGTVDVRSARLGNVSFDVDRLVVTSSVTLEGKSSAGDPALLTLGFVAVDEALAMAGKLLEVAEDLADRYASGDTYSDAWLGSDKDAITRRMSGMLTRMASIGVLVDDAPYDDAGKRRLMEDK